MTLFVAARTVLTGFGQNRAPFDSLEGVFGQNWPK